MEKSRRRKMEPSNRVKVFVRIKPTASFAEDYIKLHDDKKSMTVHCKKDKRRKYLHNQVLEWKFDFDGVLHNASQETTFKKCASELVTRALDGYNGTLFAYGETGAGKTYTMTGKNDFKHRGIIPRALTQMYKEIKERYDYDINIRISYMQIYRDNIYDLLETSKNTSVASEQLVVTEDDNGATYVKGLSCHPAQTEEEALSLLFEGESNRIISHHQLNKFSSRSHCIFSIFIELRSRTMSSEGYSLSKLNLVDLAGSERIGKTLAEGKAQEEAMHINKSLTFLEQAVIALADQNREHVPYRQSKLTHVLKDSIGGSCLTVMIGNIWGEFGQLEETFSTLRFGNRVKCIPYEPAINFIYDPIKVCKSLQNEINSLRNELSMYDTLSNRRQITYEPLSETQVSEVKKQVRQFIDGQIDEIDILSFRQVKEVFKQFKLHVEKTEVERNALQERQATAAQDRIETPQPLKRALSAKGAGVRGKADTSGSGQLQGVDLQVGELDGQSFGVGNAPSHVKAQHGTCPYIPKKGRKGSRRELKKVENGPDSKRTPSPIDNTKLLPSGDDAQVTPPGSRTPPPKEDAFEEFRKEKGKEVNDVLAENKDILRSKKMEAKEAVCDLNNMKKELDECKEKLEIKRNERESQDQDHNQDEPIIDEDEYLLIKGISDLKLRYRSRFEELQNLRSDISYCEEIVHLCRQRLITEFDVWYTDSFGTPVAENAEKPEDLKPEDSKKDVKSIKITEDEREKFDRLRMELLMEDPDSIPFYNAKSQTERRQLYGGTNKRRPGNVVPQVRNKPPTSLIIE